MEEFTLWTNFFREGKSIVAYCPSLDLASSGKTLAAARKNIKEATRLFLQEIDRMGTKKDVLLELGWTKRGKSYVPPEELAHEKTVIKLMVAA